MDKNFLLSVIIPCFNEEGNIVKLYSAIKDELILYPNHEIIFINDGSKDDTLNIIKALAIADKKLKYISLSRNFGHQNALKAAIDRASGDCIISMDADMQHPPHLIGELIEKWKQGYEIVYTIRLSENKLPVIKKITSKYFYKFLNLIAENKIQDGAADFRLIDKKVAGVIKNLQENYLFIRGLISWVGFKQIGIEFKTNERFTGSTKYSFYKMIKFATSGISAFSVKPLKLSILIGFFVALVSFIYALYAVYVSIFTNHTIQGWTSVIVSVLFMGGIQLIMIGILGEYLGKLFIENKRRPNYIISETNC
jgi:dolichol-phosphate mannosyltransferase